MAEGKPGEEALHEVRCDRAWLGSHPVVVHGLRVRV